MICRLPFAAGTAAVGAKILCVLILWETGTVCAREPLLTVSQDMDLEQFQRRDVRLSIARHEGRPVLRIEAGHQQPWPGATLQPADPWNLAAFEAVSVDVRNDGRHAARVGMRLDSSSIDGQEHFIQVVQEIAPGQKKTLRLPLQRRMPPALRGKLFGMRGYPGQLHPDRGIDATRVTHLQVFLAKPDRDRVLELEDVHALGTFDQSRWLSGEIGELFPMIDRFGQYKHGDWPGKIHSEQQLRQRIEQEDADMASHPGPEQWNRFGGWQGGPQLQATGRFTTAKHEGVWWLVDPEGRLFWSHGIDCVRTTNATTPITDREFYFAELPGNDSPLEQFYGQAAWAPHGYYRDKGTYRMYNFTGANLYRKYGPQWRDAFRSRAHQRLRSWAMNTIGNWSEADIYRAEQTPYVVTVSSGRTPIQGSTGYWGQFPDPFTDDFRDTTRRNMAAQRDAARSPWCLGVFIDNEIAWGDELSLAIATLASPAGQAAKQVFVADLQENYSSIAQLNDAWGTEHRSWQELLESREPPDHQRAREDLQAFYTRIAEKYFQVCRDAAKEVAPDTLYLGCRFAWVNDRAIRSAARFCDVISFNLYRDSVGGFRLPQGVDGPVIIGEFHFGALDRGMFHTGLRPTSSQQERADAYRRYVRSALDNPWIVGTHWFQFGDQATTGRGDGENYQIGFLDVGDTPYPETIAASREVGAEMYQRRLGQPARSPR